MSEQIGVKQTIEELTQRYNLLNTKRIQAETNLANAQQQLEEEKAKARQEFQTDDLEELKGLLAQWQKENEEKRSAYQQALDKIESDLNAVEDMYSDLDEGSSADSEA